MSRILVDSSVIIESLKGNEKALELFRSIKDDELAINPIVFSEVVYIFMRYGKKVVNKVLDLLNSFIMLDLTKEIMKIAENYIAAFLLCLVNPPAPPQHCLSLVNVGTSAPKALVSSLRTLGFSGSSNPKISLGLIT